MIPVRHDLLIALVATTLAGCTLPGAPREAAPPTSTPTHEGRDIEVTGPGVRHAQVGDCVRFPYSYTVVPAQMFHITVQVNGEPIAKPELDSAQSNPGCARFAYVFRPRQKGTYRIQITRHFSALPSEVTDDYTVIVTGRDEMAIP